MNYKKLLTSVAAAAIGASLPFLSHAFDAVPLVGPVLSALVVTLAHVFDAPKAAPKA